MEIKKRTFGLFGLACLACAGCGGGSSHPSVRGLYKITDLGMLPNSTESDAVGIDAQGDVAGHAFVTDPGQHYTAFLYHQGVLTSLGIPADDSGSRSVAINATGQVLVRGFSNQLTATEPLCLSNQGVLNVLDSRLAVTLNGSDAAAISNSGAVLATTGDPWATSDPNPLHLALSSGGTVTDLGTPVEGTRLLTPDGLNAAGQAVATARDSDGLDHAYLLSSGSFQALGVLPNDDASYASAINDAGQITGYSADQATVIAVPGSALAHAHAFLWSKGRMNDLGTLPGDTSSYGDALNNQGDVVGQSGDNGKAVLFSHGLVIDLNTRIPADSGWMLGTATGINDKGQICGNGTHNGLNRAFLLAPQ
jgi:probable HAF family extracellular repeat protein